jgi:hypothetical protein
MGGFLFGNIQSLKLTAKAEVVSHPTGAKTSLSYCHHAANEKLISGYGVGSWSRRSPAYRQAGYLQSVSQKIG